MKEKLLALATPFAWNTTGLLLCLFGVILLFRYGMPYRISTSGGGDFITTESSSEPPIVDKIYRTLGWLGLIAIVAGTGCQIAGAYIS
ncbi:MULTISPECIES: hypothetical protein [Bradyrhizobium]|uniref:hypothetical protein n=1 Tax=Bradyrhizobium TaxID=374 RepID=UPI0005780D8F|nr:hypothetical protein [Bradyrhizobium sp. CCBAU 15544]